jgi:hypothetical protein
MSKYVPNKNHSLKAHKLSNREFKTFPVNRTGHFCGFFVPSATRLLVAYLFIVCEKTKSRLTIYHLSIYVAGETDGFGGLANGITGFSDPDPGSDSAGGHNHQRIGDYDTIADRIAGHVVVVEHYNRRACPFDDRICSHAA